tara:strand:+ start:368 stop:628 length:261 start_codon:yes stop_codon:yes gene_type:complete
MMTECKNCGQLATKNTSLTGAIIDCECGTYTEYNDTPESEKAVIYDRTMMEYRVADQKEFWMWSPTRSKMDYHGWPISEPYYLKPL